MSPSAIETRELTVDFGSRRALDGVTLSIPRGASVAVLGPNGAGKSTLFAATVGLVTPRSGSIRLGSDRIAFVPQRLDVEPSFPVTVRDVVGMGRYGDLGPFRRFGSRDHDLVAGAIAALEVDSLRDRRFGTLSGGERQRALLAQAAAQDADVLLLDEPFTGVDAPTRERVRSLVECWRAEGRTVLVATHDLASAAREYELVVCLNRRLVAFGPPAETFSEEVLAETFAGHVIRVGELVVDIAHHHRGAS